MKNILNIILVILLFTGSSFAQAENYKAFKVDFLFGYANPTTSTSSEKGGLVFSLEPKYNITDKIAVGLKAEGAVLASITDKTSNDGYISLVNSYSLTGEYYFGDSRVRPFAGLGIGTYTLTVYDTDDFEQLAKGKSNIGFAPRAGLQIGHFRLVGEYNLVKDSDYLTFKLGWAIGGGKK